MSSRDRYDQLRAWFRDVLGPDDAWKWQPPAAEVDPEPGATWMARVEAGTEPSPLGRALASLSEDERTALTLTIWDGRDAAWVGWMLGVPVAEAETLIGAARRGLRAEFARLAAGTDQADADPLVLLAGHDPVAEIGPAPRFADDLVAQEQRAGLLGGSGRTGQTRRRWRGRTGGAIIVAVVVAGSASGAAAWIATRSPTVTTTVGCYSEVSLHPKATVVVAAGSGTAVQACRSVWATGSFARPGAPVPPLAACVLPTGYVGVFPATGGDPCATLGLPVASGASPDDTKALAVQDYLSDQFTRRCVPPSEGVDLARAELERVGLHGWTVRAAAPRDPTDTCSSVAVDQATKTITVVPLTASVDGPGDH
jgi:hypothetical protein